MPLAIPDDEPMATILVLLLLQLPPVTALVNVCGTPTHTLDEPDIVAGNGLIVITAVAVQPVDNA
jgi:hypothetical protein